ncbi:MAG: hypothetical protein IKY30_01070 [Oscillospiraceae bacterium]|nr:hypothetical protein [Oscillospiraceae bacterium]
MLKLIGRLLLFLPIFLGMMFVSYRVDPSGLFWGRGFERMASEYMLEGMYIAGYERLDGRALNEVFAKNIPQAPEILVTGSSRSMMIDSSFAPDRTLYNAANVGADRFDFMTAYYIFGKENKDPQVIVMGLDAWLFNDGEDNIDKRSNKELYYEFIGEELGVENTSYEKPNPYEKYEALIDPSYFQGSVKYYFKDKSADVQPEPVPIEEIYEKNEVIKAPDGSIIYDKKFRTNPPEIVDIIVNEEARYDPLRLGNFDGVSPEYKELFEKFVQYLLEKDIKIVFYLPPYHQVMFDKIVAGGDYYGGMFETEEYLIDIADKYGITVCGSYNPQTAGVTNADFYDSIHARPEAVKRMLGDAIL